MPHNNEGEDHGHDDHLDGHEGQETAEANELNQAVELICKAAKEGEKSGIGVDSLAAAAHFFKSSILTAPFHYMWNLAPASVQRGIGGTDQSEIGKFLMRYMPMANPRAYLAPAYLVVGLARAGVLDFKLTKEEEVAMHAQLGQTPSEEAKIAYNAKLQENLLAGIVMPYEGAAEALTGKVGTVITAVQPELTPVAVAAQGTVVLEGARDGYFKQVRERVHGIELEVAKAKEAAKQAKDAVPGTATEEHDKIAAADPQAGIPPLAPQQPKH